MNVAAILKEKGKNVITAGPDATLLAIAETLREHRIGCVIVCGDDGAIAGIVSERDIVRALAERGPAVLESPVSKSMTKKVISCRETDTIDYVMAEMTAGRFRHLPVMNGNELVGLVSIGDVVKLRIAEAEMEAAAMREYIATG